MPADAPYEWVGADERWLLVDENGRAVRQFVNLGPCLGPAAAVYRVLGGDRYTNHGSRSEAMVAAEASLEDCVYLKFEGLTDDRRAEFLDELVTR